MPTVYYAPSGNPSTGAQGLSSLMRSEFVLLDAAFALLPTPTGNGSKAVVVNGGGTALTITVGTLALAGDLSMTGAFSTTLAASAPTVLTLPGASGTLALLASPAFTGTATAPTAAPGTNTTQLATTAFSTAVGSVTATGSTTSRTLANRFADAVNVKDFGAVGDGVTDDTAAIQAAIDASPSTGRGIYFPSSVYRAHGVKLQGTAGTKTNIVLTGAGFSSQIKSPAASALNVIEGTAGSGHGINNLRLSGSKDTGGTPVRGPTRGFWVSGATYLINETVEVSAADIVTTTVAASNLVYRCTVGHVAGATFLADKAARWALSAAPNFNTSDMSYRYRNGIYLDGVANCQISSVFLDQHVYAGINPGTGPVQTANAGPGSDRVQISNAIIADCENGMAGGKWRDHELSNIQIYSCTVYGIVVDISSYRVTIDGATVVGCGNNGIYAYSTELVTINRYTIAGCLNGIVSDGGTSLLNIGEGTISGCTNYAMFLRGAAISQIGGLVASANARGVEFDTCSQMKINRITVNASTGSSGFKATSSSLISFGDVQTIGNSGHGIELQSCDAVSITGATAMNNNSSAAASGSGVYGNNTTNVTITGGSQIIDTRAGGARTQNYGVLTAGTSGGWSVVGNRVTNNVTSNTTFVGGSNTELLNNSPITVDRIGSAIAAASVPAAFAAGIIITVRDISGATRYVPAMNTVW